MAKQVYIAHESSDDWSVATAVADAARIAYPGDGSDEAIDAARYQAKREGNLRVMRTEAWLRELAGPILAETTEIEEA